MTDENVTNQRDTKYKENRACPNCGSTDLSPQATDHGGDFVVQVMGCIDCEATWEENYNFVGIQNIKLSSLYK